MKKPITIIAVLVALGVAAYFLLGNRMGDITETSDDIATTSNGEVSGEVISVNTDGVAADGPSHVTIKKPDGSEVVIAIKSMGINLCPAQDSIANPYDLKVGDKVSAKGQVGEDGVIVPCESAEDYLKVTE
jgi:hypothetical protein